MSKKYEIDVKDFIGKSFKTTMASCGYVNNYGTSILKQLYYVCVPLTPEHNDWYYEVQINGENKLNITSLRAAVEEYNKY